MYVCVRDVIDVVFSVYFVRRGAVGARVWEVSVSACRCCMFVSCVYPYGRSILQIRSHDCFVGVMSVSFCFPHSLAVSAFIICRGLRACTEKL